MIRSRIARTLKALCASRSGNSTMLVALGMPVLIGGAGLGVDLSQWYMWKRELQFAVDQAAVAAAWARTDEATESTYITRAEQEFAANIAATEGFSVTPTVQLANYAGGTDNSVAVFVTASKKLPFSHFLTGQSANVYAYAQASFEEGETFTSCLIATDEDDMGAVTIGGSSVLTASCGIAALSTDELAIRVDGNPTVDAGWILSAGGVDDWLKENTDDVILENMEGLYDPYKELEPPSPAESQTARTYSCDAEADTTTADIATRVQTTYDYFIGSSQKQNSGWENNQAKPDTDVTSTSYGQIVPEGTQVGTTTSSSVEWTQVGGKDNEKQWERATIVTTKTTTNVQVAAGAASGNVRPGTYSNIHVACNTTFQSGVYHIDGGGLIINGQHEVTGSAVMFVLHNGAYVQINGGADINLTAMQASDLMAVGVPFSDANDLAGMLVFEDRDSEGTNKNNINGNAATVLNGTLYFPVSEVYFAGTATVTSQCLMIAANNIIITGTTNMETFCPAGSSEDTTVATTASKVRLIA